MVYFFNLLRRRQSYVNIRAFFLNLPFLPLRKHLNDIICFKKIIKKQQNQNNAFISGVIEN